MAIYKPSELRLFLDTLGVSPKKGLSQNFLIDGNILRKIVALSLLKAGEVVLEIGPGPGSLTQLMLEKGARVIAVEKDPLFAEALHRLQTEDERLTVYSADIMDFPLEEKIAPLLGQGEKAKVIANLPYHLTTPILNRLLPLDSLFSSLTLMVQEEVARRMNALPGSSDYSSLTLFLEYYCNPHYGFMVGRNCFYPVPKVDSAVVILNLKKAPLPESDLVPFFKMKRRAFEQRRKMIRSSLKELYDSKKIEEILLKMGLAITVRPENLSLEEFLKLYALLKD